MKSYYLNTVFITLTLILSVSCNETINLSKLNNNPAVIPPGPSNTPPGEEWVQVSANAGGRGLPVFYVMKYEAKAMLNDESSTNATGTTAAVGTHKPVSIADNLPWTNINATDATAECESRGPKFHLISNIEWMAIARNAELQPTNWTGDAVGSGCLFRGNTGEAIVGDGTSVSDSCGYNNSGNPEGGSSRDIRAGHTLSSGQVVFDLSANVEEWVDWERDTPGFQGVAASGPHGCTNSGELNTVGSCGALLNDDFNTSTGTYDRSHGVGYFLGGNDGFEALTRGHASAHGGSHYGNDYAGLFSMYSRNLTHTHHLNGFRCVYRP